MKLKYVLTASFAAVVGMAAGSSEAAELNTVVSFSGTNGKNPRAGLILGPGGDLYGTTYAGGANSRGTIFRFDPEANALDTLISFAGRSNGSDPRGTLVADEDGNLFGTTTTGGTNGYGTVFKFDTASNTLTRLASFTGSTASPRGLYAYGGLAIDHDGNLYGTDYLSEFYGSTFKLDAANNYAFSTLQGFNGTGPDGIGANPESSLIIGADGNLYGTASAGGLGNLGTVFRYNVGSDTVSRLVSFNGSGNGARPKATLLADADGDLYGTTYEGGENGEGTIFVLDAQDGYALTTLATFDGATNGANPYGDLIADAAGNLYGTTYAGGANDKGTVFMLDAADDYSLVTLATFDGTNGANPYGGLFVDAAGDLYGTTYNGGTNNNGTIFKISDAGFAIPEPGTLALLGVTGLGLLRRRRA